MLAMDVEGSIQYFIVLEMMHVYQKLIAAALQAKTTIY
jgi:hypothetical protein